MPSPVATQRIFTRIAVTPIAGAGTPPFLDMRAYNVFGVAASGTPTELKIVASTVAAGTSPVTVKDYGTSFTLPAGSVYTIECLAEELAQLSAEAGLGDTPLRYVSAVVTGSTAASLIRSEPKAMYDSLT